MNDFDLITSDSELPDSRLIDKELFTKKAEESTNFSELMMMYRSAIREVQTKLEVLNDEFKTRRQRNPIESIKSRIKSPTSIYHKLAKRGKPLTLQ